MSQGEKMDFPVDAPGAKQSADDMNRLGDSMKKSAGQWDQLSQKSSKAAAGLGAMSAALGPLGAEFGALGSAVSRSAGIITTMTSLLGGPWGVAIGVAAAAVGFLAKQFTDATKEAEEFAAAASKVQTSLDIIAEKNEAARKVANRKLSDDMLMADAATGIWQNSNKARLAAMDLDIEAAEAEGKIGKNVGEGGGRGGKKPKTLDELMSGASSSGNIGDLANGGDNFGNIEADMYAAERDAIAEADAIAKAEALEAERAHLEGIEAMRQGQLERDIARHEEMMRLEEQRHGFVSGMLEDQGKIAIRAANEAAKGHAMGKKAALQAIGDALVARGTAAIAEGGIWSSVPFMWGSGAPMIAMGATAIGVGVAMGAASRAIPSGGGGKAPSTGTPQLAPASPVALDRTGGNAGPTTIMVNVPTVLSASGEDGKRVVDAIEQAKREGRI